MSSSQELMSSLKEMLVAAKRKDLQKIKELDEQQAKIISDSVCNFYNKKALEADKNNLVDIFTVQNKLIAQVIAMRGELSATDLGCTDFKHKEGDSSK